MTRREWVEERWPEDELEQLAFLDDLDDAIIGIGSNPSKGYQLVLLYDREKCIKILAEKFSMQPPEEDPGDYDAYTAAEEWFSYNTERARLYALLPITFVDVIKEEDL